MKAITLWQPYATLIAIGAKRFETRHWQTHYRGPIAIHAAARKMTDDEIEAIAETADFHRLVLREMPLGAVVATATLDDCFEMWTGNICNKSLLERDVGNWDDGRFAWQLGNVRALPEPIPVKGRQGFWNWEPPAGFEP